MGNWDFTHPAYEQDYRNHDLNMLYERYFDLIGRACRSGLFDIIGHIDVIKKFGYRPHENLESLWSETAQLLKNNGTCIEVNTAGRDAPVGSFYPDQCFLELCFKRGVPVTLGSDAHEPAQVGRYFKEALAMIKAAGYSEISVFTRRIKSGLPL